MVISINIIINILNKNDINKWILRINILYRNSFLPQRNNEEFKPFQRKVKEYQFWNVMFFTLLIGIILTFFDSFDIPVFWPLLLVYFILIFILTMKNQIKHMIKYNYLPWDAGKISYNVK